MTESDLRKYVRKQLLFEADPLAELTGGAEGDPAGEDEKKDQYEQNRKDEIIDTIRRIFKAIKNDAEMIDRYRRMYEKIHANSEESKALFLNKLFRMIKSRFLFLLRLLPRDVEATKLFEKDTIPVINEELEKAYINMKERVTS